MSRVERLLRTRHAISILCHLSISLAEYVQLRNALDATNAVIYTGSVDRCRTPEPPTKVRAQTGVCDYYTRGLPLLPLAGVRVSF